MKISVSGIRFFGATLLLFGCAFGYILYKVVIDFDNPANWLYYLSLSSRLTIIGDRFSAWYSVVGLGVFIITCNFLGFYFIANANSLFVMSHSWKGKLLKNIALNLLITISAIYGIAIILMFTATGFLFGFRSMLQRMGLMISVCGDENWQILLDFSVGLIGLFVIYLLGRKICKSYKKIYFINLKLLRVVGSIITK